MRVNSRSFFGRLMISHIVVILISLAVIGIIFGYLVQSYYFGLREWKATNKGRRIAKLVSNNVTGKNLRSNELESARKNIDTIARSANLDIGIINEQGTFVFASTNLTSFDLGLKSREINRVLEGNSITKKIRGPEHKNLLMVFPLLRTDDGQSIIMGPNPPEGRQIIGGIIVRSPMGSITETIHEIIRMILFSFLVAIIAAVGLSFLFAKRVTEPLARINKAALEITEGKFKKVALPENSSQEIKSLVETFNYAVDQVDQTLRKKEQLEQMRKQFVVDVSHEFRAPLTSIKGFLEILQDQKLKQSEINNYVKIMYKDTEYLEHLIDDLAVLGKLDSGYLDLEREVTTPQKVVNKSLNSLRNKLQDKNIKIKTLVSKLPKLYVDPNRLHQVMINLLDNAITYSPSGGEIKIVTNFKPEAAKIEFSILDQGPGIPPAETENIWQRFYKVDAARTRQDKEGEGSGLGLAIVKEIIEQHGGRVEVENLADQGAKFSFILNNNSIIKE